MQSEPQYAQVNGVRIAYERTGQGYPILLIHGFPRDRRVWRKITPILANRFTVVAMDRRGYGESDRPTDPAGYDNRTMTEDAFELTRQLDWDRFVILGHDRGAPEAQRLAIEHPEVVAGLVVLDSLPQGARSERGRDPMGRSWYLDFYRQRGVAEQIMGQNPRLFFSLFLARHPHLTPEEHEAFLEPFSRPGAVEAVLADYRHGLEDDQAWWEAWHVAGNKFNVPVCVLWAERGPSGSAPVLEAWQRVADDVRGAMILSTAHYLQEEQPEAVAKLVLKFADELGIH